MIQIVPLTTSPNQNLIVPLNIDGAVRDQQLYLHYNEIAHYWVLTFIDANGVTVLDNIPLITGDFPAANILGQFAYLGLGSVYILNASQVDDPNYPKGSDLGTDFLMVWDDTPVVQ